MIIADENISAVLISSLRSLGIEVLSVREEWTSISDEEILDRSLTPPRIILTEDKDFGEWIFSFQKKSMGIVFLRYHIAERAAIHKVVCDLIEEQGESLYGKFTTVTTTKIRSRDL